jgi:hypothetical protein
MLDEPVGSLPLHWRGRVFSPLHVISRKGKNEGSSHFLLPLDRGTSSVRAKIDHKPIEPLHKPIEALTTAAKAAVRKA